MTHSYAVVKVSHEAFTEIRKILECAGYQNQFHGDNLIDMHGLAIQRDASHDDNCMDCGQKPNNCQCG